MPRRRVLTEAQLEMLFALPTTEADLALHWTLSPADHAAIQGRRGDHNRLGFTLQLCALRYPGRLLRPGEPIPPPALNYLASQLTVDPGALAAYAARFQTRYEQLDNLRRLFGYTTPERPQRRELLDWLLPVALATTRTPAIAAALMDEIRRRQFIAPGPSVIERMVAAAVPKRARRMPCCAMHGRSTTKCACSPNSVMPCSPPRRQAAIRWKQLKPRSDGSASPAAWRKRAGWCARTRPTSPRLHPAPGRCCAASGHLSWMPSAFVRFRPLPACCVPWRCFAASTRTTAGLGRAACRSPFSNPAGAARCWLGRLPTGEPGKWRRCWHCATGCAPATSGSRAAGNGGPLRISSSRPPCSRACVPQVRCWLPCRTPQRAGSKSAAPCSRSG